MSKLQANLKGLKAFASNLERAKRATVAVGLPVENVGGKVYGDGMSIVQVGAMHEYGFGNNPQRSFLRLPFQLHKDKIDDFIASQFAKVLEGQSVDKALGLIGIKAQNISTGAFTTGGYGNWPALSPGTVKAKGSSRELIDTGTLRNSISWVVR